MPEYIWDQSMTFPYIRIFEGTQQFLKKSAYFASKAENRHFRLCGGLEGSEIFSMPHERKSFGEIVFQLGLIFSFQGNLSPTFLDRFCI